MRTLTPFSPLFEQSFERLLGDPATSTRYIPIDVTEENDVLTVRATLPGIAPEAVSVQVVGNVLTIQAERQPEPVGENAKVYRRESVYGPFVRSLRLGERLDADSIRADAKDGVLTLTIARVPKEQPRRIAINGVTSDASAPVLAENSEASV